ncbi:MAG: hypothetical protein ABH803_02975 [Candidatus Micrarchaeota archaeon]
MRKKTLKIKKIARKIIKAEKKMSGKLDKLLDEWKGHIHEQIKLHERILSGKHSVKALLDQTIKIEKNFIKKVSKIK